MIAAMLVAGMLYGFLFYYRRFSNLVPARRYQDFSVFQCSAKLQREKGTQEAALSNELLAPKPDPGT